MALTVKSSISFTNDRIGFFLFTNTNCVKIRTPQTLCNQVTFAKTLPNVTFARVEQCTSMFDSCQIQTILSLIKCVFNELSITECFLCNWNVPTKLYRTIN